MFDLEKSVAAWREALSRGGTCSGADLDELEAHLRESVQRLRAAGLSEEEAFLISVRRLGRPDGLAVEYGKAHPERVWRERAVWMLAGVVSWAAIGGLASPVFQVGMIGAASVGVHDGGLQWAWVTAGIVQLMMEGMLAWVVYRHAIAGRFRSRPGVWVVVGVTAIFVGFLATQFAIMGMARLLTPSDISRTFLAVRYLEMAIRLLLMPVILGVIAIRLGRKSQSIESC